jgi:hypothetical protein
MGLVKKMRRSRQRTVVLLFASTFIFVTILLSVYQPKASAAIVGGHVAEVHSSTDAVSYATGSWTPTASRLEVASVLNSFSGAPNTPTMTGNGLTWSQVATYQPDTSGTQYRMTLFVALSGASPTTGATTADFAAQLEAGGDISIEEFSGADISGTALNAIAQSVTGSANATGLSESIALGSLANANNASFGFFMHQAAEATVQGTGYSLLHSGSHTAPSGGIGTEDKVPGSTTVDASWTTSAGKGGIAAEIKVGALPAGHYVGVWRWYSDATPDSSMTAQAAESTTPTLSGTQMQNAKIRLRIQIIDTTGSAGSGTIALDYSEDSGSTWNPVQDQTPTSGKEGYWFRWANGAATAGNTISQNDLTGTTESGKYIEASGTTESIGANATHEMDLALYVHWPPPDSTIQFRIVYGGSALSLFSGNNASLTTSAASDRGSVSITRLDADGLQKTSREMRYASWPRFYYDGTRWWFFTVYLNTPTIVRSFSWDGSGGWTARDTVNVGSASNQTQAAFAFKTIGGTPTVFVHAGSSTTSRVVVKGTISGTTITWGSTQTVTQNSDRTRHIAVDDGNFVWIGGIQAATGVWAARSTNSNDVTAWNASLTAADASVVSGDIFTLVGLSSDKALAIWHSGTVLKYSILTSAGFGSVTTLNSSASAGAEDWGVTRTGGFVYVIHSDSTSAGGNWKLRVFDETGSTWSDGTSPAVSGQASVNDGITLTSSGGTIYALGTFTDTEGGQARKLSYKTYSGGTAGTWGSLTDISSSSGNRGNGDHVDTGDIQGGGKVIFGWNFNDDDTTAFARTAEYHYISVPNTLDLNIRGGVNINGGSNLR